MNPIYSYASLDALPGPEDFADEVGEEAFGIGGGAYSGYPDEEGTSPRDQSLSQGYGCSFGYGYGATAVRRSTADSLSSPAGAAEAGQQTASYYYYEGDGDGGDEGGGGFYCGDDGGPLGESSRLVLQGGASFPIAAGGLFYSSHSFGSAGEAAAAVGGGYASRSSGRFHSPNTSFNFNTNNSLSIGAGGGGRGSMGGGGRHGSSLARHQRTGTIAGVTMNTLCNVMGAGVLALPLAFHNASVVTSLALLLLSAFISLKAVHILGIGCDAVHRYSFTECVVLSLFPVGPEERRRCLGRGIDPMLSSTARLIATFLLELVIVVESFGTLVVYARVIADSMPPVLSGLGLPAAEHPLATLFLSWVLPSLTFFALSCSRSMEELKWTSVVGFGTILYIVFVVVYKYVEFVIDNSPALAAADSGGASGGFWGILLRQLWDSLASAVTSAAKGSSSSPDASMKRPEGIVLAASGVRWFAIDSGVFAAMSTYSLAFGYHFNVPYFYSELKDRRPTNLLKTVYYALPIVTVSYALTGVLGYLQVGPSVAGRGGGNIIDRMDSASFLVNIGRIGLLFHFATVYPVISVCARRGLHRLIALSRLFLETRGYIDAGCRHGDGDEEVRVGSAEGEGEGTPEENASLLVSPVMKNAAAPRFGKGASAVPTGRVGDASQQNEGDLPTTSTVALMGRAEGGAFVGQLNGAAERGTNDDADGASSESSAASASVLPCAAILHDVEMRAAAASSLSRNDEEEGPDDTSSDTEGQEGEVNTAPSSSSPSPSDTASSPKRGTAGEAMGDGRASKNDLKGARHGETVLTPPSVAAAAPMVVATTEVDPTTGEVRVRFKSPPPEAFHQPQHPPSCALPPPPTHSERNEGGLRLKLPPLGRRPSPRAANAAKAAGSSKDGARRFPLSASESAEDQQHRVLPPRRTGSGLSRNASFLSFQQQQQQPHSHGRGMPLRSANLSVTSVGSLAGERDRSGGGGGSMGRSPTAPPPPGDPSTTSRRSIVLEAAFIVLMGTIFAWNVPGVGLVIEFLGAFFGIPTQMIVPGLIGIRLFRAGSGHSRRWWMVHVVERSSMRRELRYAVMLVAIGAVCTVFGVARAVGGGDVAVAAADNDKVVADNGVRTGGDRNGTGMALTEKSNKQRQSLQLPPSLESHSRDTPQQRRRSTP